MTWATVKGNGWSYTFTDSDYLWGCRMLVGENESVSNGWEVDAHLWAILNTQYLGRFPSWTAAARSYSFPINPEQLDPATARRPEQIPRRRRIQALSLEQIPDIIKGRVRAFMEGDPKREGGGKDLTRLRHFTDCSEADARERLGAPDVEGPSGQCFWNAPVAVPAWTFGEGPAEAGGDTLALLGLLLLLAGDLYYLTRK